MHAYFVKTPWLVKQIFSSYEWSMPSADKEVFLTFDDGPHPTITPFVLDLLKQHGAKATFFCVGDNVRKYPDVYRRIIDEGHSTGNHTYHHLNGWKTPVERYTDDIKQAASLIHSNLFRPPYGKITRRQYHSLNKQFNAKARVIMWDVLSADFDANITKEQCLQNVVRHYTQGSVIVLHDSEKAFNHLAYVLPLVLEDIKRRGYCSKKIEPI